jgi:hypothetical protein
MQNKTNKAHLTTTPTPPVGAVLPTTRWLALFVIPFLVAAVILLYIWPNDTEKTFAWTIKPSMTPMMLAAAYMGGIVFFVQVLRSARWTAVKVGFLPVTTFASLLGIATILHWDRFNHSHISFFAWTGLYFTAPFLVMAAYLSNRAQDIHPVSTESVDTKSVDTKSVDTESVDTPQTLIPTKLRAIIGVIGSITLVVSLFLFLSPDIMIGIWPWKLTPLTARVVGAMFSLPGVVGLGIAFEPRWSAARVILQAQGVSILMILIAAGRAWADFDTQKIGTWLFLGGLSGLFLLIAGLYIYMEYFRKRKVSGKIEG